MAEIPNVVLGNEPHTDIITSAKRPNMWSLDRRPVKPGKGKKKTWFKPDGHRPR